MISLLSVLALTLAFSGCGGSEGSSSASDDSNNQSGGPGVPGGTPTDTPTGNEMTVEGVSFFDSSIPPVPPLPES